MNTASYDWLIVGQSIADFNLISDGLNTTAGRFDQNILAALPDLRGNKNITLDLCKNNFIYRKKGLFRKNLPKNKNHSINTKLCRYNNISLYNCNTTEHEIKYFRNSTRFTNLTRHQNYKSFGKTVPLWRSGILNLNFSASFYTENISDFSLRHSIRKWKKMHNIEFNHINIHLLQFFKIRFNSTLFVTYLGNSKIIIFYY